MKLCNVFSLEWPRQRDFNEFTQHTIFNIKKKITLNYLRSAAMGFFFKETQERVRNSRGKGAISVRATEGLLYGHGMRSSRDVMIKWGFPDTCNAKSGLGVRISDIT